MEAQDDDSDAVLALASSSKPGRADPLTTAVSFVSVSDPVMLGLSRLFS